MAKVSDQNSEQSKPKINVRANKINNIGTVVESDQPVDLNFDDNKGNEIKTIYKSTTKLDQKVNKMWDDSALGKIIIIVLANIIFHSLAALYEPVLELIKSFLS